MPFDQQAFEDAFGFDVSRGIPLELMVDFQVQEENDEFEIYRAVIATAEQNPNNLYLDEDTLKNIAQQANRETAGKDIPVFPLHNKYDFQIGTMLTAEYQSANKRVVGTFQISKDAETEVLRRRMKNGTVKGISPSVRGPVECNYCNEKMYRYGGCKNGHYLGEIVIAEGGDEVVIEGTFKNANLVEVSVVSLNAFPGAEIFSENKELLKEAYSAKVIDDKTLDVISQNFSVDIDISNSQPQPQPEPASEPEGEPPMPQPTDADTKLLQDQITDLKADVAAKDKQIGEFQTQIKNLEESTVKAEDHNKTAEELTQAKADLINKESELGKANAVVSEYDACVEHTRTKCIELYAKVRGVETDCTTDALFSQRKKALEESKSLSYLLSSLDSYYDQYYAQFTEFGSGYKPEKNDAIPSDYTPASGLA